MVLRRRFARGSLGFELLQAQRFGRGDTAVALDDHVDAWHRGYANLRYQDSGGDGLLPDAWRVELFQGVGQGWELSAGVDQLSFPSSSTDIYSVGVGRYAGNVYIRARTGYVGSSGSLSHQATVRWYTRATQPAAHSAAGAKPGFLPTRRRTQKTGSRPVFV